MDSLKNRASARTICVAILASLPLGGVMSARADMTGKWKIDEANGATAFVDITHVNNEVSFQLDGHSFTGELSGALLRVTDFATANRGGITGVVSPDQTHLRATMGFIASFPVTISIVGERCQCSPEDSNDGSGCNARCPVEECITCETESSCAPSPNGTPCNDGNICSAGETCTDGVCGGGSVATSCIDLSGTWRWRTVLTDPIQLESDYPIRFVQTGTFLEVIAPPAFGAASAGSIDPATGAFELHAILQGTTFFGCALQHSPGGARGNASADGLSLTGTVTFIEGPPPSCAAFDEALTGTRCVHRLRPNAHGEEPCVACPGDCNRDGSVTVDELVRSVGITLSNAELYKCTNSDLDLDGTVAVNELVSAVRSLLAGCGGS